MNLLHLIAILALAPPGGSAPPAARLAGTVCDATLAPVPGALVRVVPDPDSSGARDTFGGGLAAETQSGADGRFTVDWPRGAALLRVEVRHPDFAPGLLAAVAPELGVTYVGPILLLPPVAVAGRVTGADGTPVAGATVFVDHALLAGRRPEDLEPAATTDDAGRFRVAGLPAGALRLGVEADGFAPLESRMIDLTDPDLGEVLLRLEAAAPRTLRVLAADGSAAGGATARAWLRGRPWPFFGLAEPADDGGRVTVETAGADAEQRVFEFRAPGAPARRLRKAELPEESSGEAEVRLGEGRHVALLLAPLEGVSEVRFDVFSRNEGAESRGWRRDDGRLEGFDLLPGRDGRIGFVVPRGDVLRVHAMHSDGRSVSSGEIALAEAPPPPASLDVRLAFPALVSVQGVVHEGGAPAAGVEVVACRTGDDPFRPLPDARARTGADGGFRLEGLPPGPQVVEARRGGAAFGRALVAPSADTPTTVELRLEPARRVSGQVLLDGAPPPVPLRVEALRYEREARGGRSVAVASAETDAAGRYVLEPLGPGRYLVVVAPPPVPADGALATWAGRHDREWRDGPQAVVLRPDGPPEATLDLAVVTPRPSFVAGRITINGMPAADLRVDLDRPGEELRELRATATDAHGRFRFRVDGAGPWRLSLKDGALADERSGDAVPGEVTRLEWDLEAGALVGRVVDPAGEGLEMRVHVEEAVGGPDAGWRPVTQLLSGEDGAVHVPRVRAGRFRLRVEDPALQRAQVASPAVDVAAGDAEPVRVPDVVVPGAAAVRVRMGVAGDARPPFARLEIRPAPPAGGMHAAPLVAPVVEGWFVEDVSQVGGLPPGRVTVRVHPYGPWEADGDQEVELAAGATTELTFAVRKRN